MIPLTSRLAVAIPLLGLALVAACGTKPEPDGHSAWPTLDTVGCYACHGDRYWSPALEPLHADAFPRACEQCHQTTAWSPAEFGDHDAWWPLVGEHLVVACASCHQSGVYTGTPRDCDGCHLPDYHATTDPNHVTAAFPTACAGCHTPAGWVPASFDAHDTWPLVGKHVDTACVSCHQGGVYTGTPRDCEGCHLPDYQATTDPNHLAQSLPEACAACHTPAGWRPASYDHDHYWPLTGAHAGAACASCHVGGVYAGTPRACVGCHQPDYQASTNPSHTARALATTCETCHGTFAWRPADFPIHDQLFRISGGDHQRYRDDCASCHLTPIWSTWTCIDCHDGEHTRAEMDDEHEDEAGYLQRMATSAPPDRACLSCHPRGEKD